MLIAPIIAVLITALCVCSICIGLWNAIKIREVHLTMNSRMDQLLTSSIAEGHAAGVEQERAREGRRVSAEDREEERRDDLRQ